jgi:hypothetical protein
MRASVSKDEAQLESFFSNLLGALSKVGPDSKGLPARPRRN